MNYNLDDRSYGDHVIDSRNPEVREVSSNITENI